MQIFHNPNYNFIRWRWHALALSAAIIIAGAVLIGTRGMTLGIDFSGGTLLIVKFDQAVSEDQVRAAVNAGFDRVWWTIVDTHVSSLIAALLLLQFGTGPIRGFAVTLIIGLLSNVFTAVFVSRTVFEIVLARRQPNAQTLSI